MHPRTRANAPAAFLANSRLQLLDPVGYLDFLALETHAAAVITDSGGVQEETTFLGVPCFTLREGTERPVTVSHGTNRVLGLAVEAIEQVPSLLADARRPTSPPPGWDGHAAERAADRLAADLLREATECAASAAR
jgi:UDP-N-acetylglucosamine 2-epimerase (non-hydrolysing)